MPIRRFKPRPAGLRLRLTLTYAATLTLLLLALGLVFREVLDYTLRRHASALLNEEWAAVKGYLKIEKDRPVWHFDKDDAEESFYVQRLRQILLLTDRQGRILEVSDFYSNLGVETSDQIRAIIQRQRPEEQLRRDADGYLYLIRNGVFIDGRREYMLAIGRSLDTKEVVVDQFTRTYFAVVPLLIFAVGVGGWYMAGRALRPLNHVAQTAQSITGDNLSLRIPLRGAGDELDHLIERFNEMVDRLQGSFNQIRQFSIDVSHELRTPLTAVRGQLEVALFTATTADQLREAMTDAIEDVEKLSNVVRALLYLSQAESGQVTIAREPVDLEALALDVLEQFQVPAELGNIQLENRLAPATILGDRVQVERLLSNLLSNAVKYTPPGGRVAVALRPGAASVDLVVSDTGRGIPPEHLPRIFERFYRVPDGQTSPDRGLGLGLSFVTWIARAHGAKVHVDSLPGRGTEFTVSFPLDGSAPAAPEPAGDRIVV